MAAKRDVQMVVASDSGWLRRADDTSWAVPGDPGWGIARSDSGV
ncbi:hypothetical protein [Streptomyces sp. NPDC052225]